jgi:energy-coupling factor transporter ATP-binding protein EcfA2
MENPNVLILDEPTNHLDLEAIEALVEGLKAFEGTLIFVSHDRWFVQALATRVVEITPDAIRDYPGTYEEYIHSCGDDHLDADQVILKAKREKKGKRGKASSENAGGATGRPGSEAKTSQPRKPKPRKTNKWKLQERHKALLQEIQDAEARIGTIDGRFAEPAFYQEVPADEVRSMDEERTELQNRLKGLIDEWEQVEGDLASLDPSVSA